MPLTFRQVHPLFVAQGFGIDMRQPPDSALMQQIVEAADRYGVLIFPGQFISDEQHVAFSRPFGGWRRRSRRIVPASRAGSIHMSPTFRIWTRTTISWPQVTAAA